MLLRNCLVKDNSPVGVQQPIGIDFAGNDSNLSAGLVAAFHEALSNKQEALKQSLQQLKDSNRYRE